MTGWTIETFIYGALRKTDPTCVGEGHKREEENQERLNKRGGNLNLEGTQGSC